MSVISVPQAFNEEDLYVDLQPVFGHSLFLKCEGFNFAGSAMYGKDVFEHGWDLAAQACHQPAAS